MKLKISLRWVLFIVSTAVITFCLVVIFFVIHGRVPQDLVGSRTNESAQSLALNDQANSRSPIRLKIPKIKVDAFVEYVGLTKEGAMETPKESFDVAWFNLGPRPGENGSAVMAGHFGWKNGTPAVFDNLNKLRKGDKIYVEDKKGMTITFVVRETRSYNPEADASGVFNSNDGQSHLNLITCEGVWDSTKKSYSNRLVIFADRE